MENGSDTNPKASESHESGRKGETVRNGGNQMQGFVRNGGQGNNHTFQRKTKSHPQRRENQLNRLRIQSGFKGTQKAAMNLIMRGITSSIRENIISSNRATQALGNVQKVVRPK